MLDWRKQLHPKLPLKDRFDACWMPEPNTGCWLWLAAVTGNGYGKIRDQMRNRSAHRVAYKLYCGPIPDGLCVRHICDVSICVNPDHLLVGTHHENVMDRVYRGRTNNQWTKW